MTGLLTTLLRGAAARAREEHLARRTVHLPSSLAELGVERRHELEELVILGVLLNHVARAEDGISKDEEEHIQEALRAKGLKAEEAALVIAASHEAAERRPDLQGFTREVNKHPYKERLRVVELLFDVAHADGVLSLVELESVREVAKLFWVEHKDFIAAKLRSREKLRG